MLRDKFPGCFDLLLSRLCRDARGAQHDKLKVSGKLTLPCSDTWQHRVLRMAAVGAGRFNVRPPGLVSIMKDDRFRSRSGLQAYPAKCDGSLQKQGRGSGAETAGPPLFCPACVRQAGRETWKGTGAHRAVVSSAVARLSPFFPCQKFFPCP